MLCRISPLLLCTVWILMVLYPNPALLARSISRSLHPQADPQAVSAWARELPDDAAYIERQVLDKYVPYSVPWQTYGVPWYFPTTKEVVERGEGDCQARMLVLASILQVKGIPYELRYSLDHAWVEYPRKRPSKLEKTALAIMGSKDGGMQLRAPRVWQLGETYRIRKELWWDHMPPGRKLLLFGGLAALALAHCILRSVLRPRLHRSHSDAL